MHISDGVLPISVALGTGAASLALAAWSVRRTQHQDLPKLAVVASSFFVASLVHVPLGPTSVHLLIPGLVGILLGRASFLAIFLGLVLQSLLFQFGGLTALGANALMMGIPALICGWLYQHFQGRERKRRMLVGGVAGGLGTVLAALLLALLLASGGEDFFGVARLALLAHVPVVAIEALVSAFTVGFLCKVKPELLHLAGAGPERTP
ncbi:cobalt transporter CbiM [Geoalkalibacter halelectricus]|uniref:Cobalt transporter CbiM n=1 Tax=Geoalkalibacter halelectricus TaxID=2847045 RepID=A0ABY5ZNM6_9BACT|nr:cobalt transporter CbiM [Geoalkalibacter halelectricus]MDO3377492.1 cobalt transporter CbiM [Geoalkalibacter halelectricus]UWZ80747.1 cobalt transporter CbiM [Geoalkalibacter halelectricus]